jgi:hypothetical protein
LIVLGVALGFFLSTQAQAQTKAPANDRFIDMGPIVLDTRTRLMWEKKDHAGSLHDVDNTYSWCQATGSTIPLCAGNSKSWIGDVNAEVFAGFNNWRVPTRDELLGIIDCSAAPPCINPVFGPTQASFYWSSTTGGPYFAWVVHFLNGLTDFDREAFYLPVRAVRRGP